MKIFIVLDNKKNIKSPGDYLIKYNYYKSYSLFLAYSKNINILNTLILTTADSIEILDIYLKGFSFPIMLRMDYSNFQNSKFIGGIPVYTLSTLKKICLFLFNNGYIPVLQSYANRFENIYSFGCSINKKDDELIIEFVGKGFDAGDLRLNLTNPHQIIRYDCTNWKILSNVIKNDEYLYAKEKRELYTGKMETYFKYANSEYKLLNGKDFNLLEVGNSKILNDEYIPVTKNQIEEAAYFSFNMKKNIMISLPFSKDYIASFSVLEGKKCVLWDIYGEWYHR